MKLLLLVFCNHCSFLVSIAENLILASNPDPDGEIIAWHNKEMLEWHDVLGFHVLLSFT